MRNIFVIANRELKASFCTPLAYVIIAGFVLLSGFFFYSLLLGFNTFIHQAEMLSDIKVNLNEWVVIPYYQTLELLLVFLIPLLTMRAISEEKRSGTFELLATSPLSVGEIVLGKFLGLFLVLFIMLLFSFIFPGVLILFADPEVPPIIVGFIGLSCFTAAFVALGVGISSFTKSQAVSGVVSLVLFLALYVVDAPASKLGKVVGLVLTYLAPPSHTENLFKGVVTGSDLIYFASVAIIGIFLANRVLDAERWR